ncbi:hypothetical protein [Nocardioides aurantiacus]|uniref:HEAT repeat protein n=1 Tax=Nocardioides aurantiacus TaxID=86796 RepID=A0A3N2CS43_9ACTN|nr:hypothetical protein [Nocardioides aurantiacus]ROR90349.1 hypothetical protein EDD33_1188 [Nocardioides aurantiacus]
MDGVFSQVLQVGGRSNSLGRTAEVVDAVVAEPVRLRELLDCVHDQDAWVRMRAVDAVEKVCRVDPGRVAPYVEELLTTWTTSDQASVQWHLAQVLRQVRLTPAQQERAIAWLAARVVTTDADWIVAVETMRTLLVLVDAGVVPADVVAGLVEVQRGHHSASVRRKADQFLEQLRRTGG